MRRNREKGVTLLIGTLSMLFIIPMMGLAIDVGFIYVVKARLQAAVDGAALAAARALSIGQDLDPQKQSAQNNAVNWFNANFPSAYFGVTNTVMTQANVNVSTDTTNPQLRNVTVSATTQVNTFFMRWLGFSQTTVKASGNASRRAVVAMLVLDRSGSMCNGASKCTGTGNSLPCSVMVTAAKDFVGSFADNSDYIGLVSFSDSTYVHSVPVAKFQEALGYTNSQGSGTGQLDTIRCAGSTGTAEAMSMAYHLIEQTNLPGALNVIVLETDGLPNALTMSFWDPVNKAAGLMGASSTTPSTCTDTTGHTMAQGGFKTQAVIPSWAFSLNLLMWPFLTTPGIYSTITPYMVGEVEAEDPGHNNSMWLLRAYWTADVSGQQSVGNSSNPYNNQSVIGPGCAFNTAPADSTPADLLWYPSADVFGNQLKPSAYSPYQSSVGTDGQGHITPTDWSNYRLAAINATENSAYRARTDPNIPITVYTLGLGGNGATDPVLLQRMANDPNGDLFNKPTNYSPCAQETGCLTFPNQPQGEFVYSKSADNLGAAFLRISSQVLRLSK